MATPSLIGRLQHNVLSATLAYKEELKVNKIQAFETLRNFVQAVTELMHQENLVEILPDVLRPLETEIKQMEKENDIYDWWLAPLQLPIEAQGQLRSFVQTKGFKDFHLCPKKNLWVDWRSFLQHIHSNEQDAIAKGLF